ncbi:S8 family serine peptidase [Haliea sp. E1-2-M8]|uniref:S8 family peptidase n=1 Tax=Haliea sp. E1-2-M8 TaxID=3064706 RepID=UPI00272713B9|nr:S8 family serine peptidase [Haliea sp. E1-2-M8]MDO8860289.1 S8 family serine peptidase [Haliea sp. E1-2-M8]
MRDLTLREATMLVSHHNLPPLALLLILTLSACGGGGGGSSTPPPPNQPPIADISAPASVDIGATVTLDGSGSSDSDGSIVSYQWQQVEGPDVELAGSTSARASFTAPSVNGDTTLAFSLTVADNAGAEASRSASVVVAGSAGGVTFSLSGSVLASANQAVDGDTNDPANLYSPNDTLATAQALALANPITLGGYVNQPGTGAEGRSQTIGDIDDYYRLELFEGQSVTLLVADFETADADLYLYSEQGEIVDFSVETGEIETVTAPGSGSWIVNVTAFTDATNYILAVGNQALEGTRQRPEIIPGEIVVEYLDAAAEQPGQPLEDLAHQMGMEQRAGARGRARLLALRAGQALQRRLGTAADRRQQFSDSTQQQRWETLLSIKSLRRTPGVRWAEPNYRVRASLQPNDSAYHLHWHYPLISLPAAWDVTTGDPGVIVAVVDTGILAGHPDLAGQLVPGYDFVRDRTTAGDGNGIDPNPADPGDRENPAASSFHGTHVAGTIAARGNNGIGVVGVAWDTRVMPLRALGASGGTSYDVAQAVRFAAGLPNDSGTVPARRADIVNLSLGGEGFSQINQQLYRDLRQAGVFAVSSAGNEASSAPGYPAAYDSVISVSAVDIQRQITSYSNRGTTIDLAAPGGDSGPDVNGDGYPDGVLSTGGSATDSTLEYAYVFLSGTSMAAPHVSGVIALMKSINPDLTPAQLTTLLQSGRLTDDLGAPGRDDLYGYGLINARRAVEAALESIGAEFVAPASLQASSLNLNFGTSLDTLTLFLSNAGSGELRVTGVDSDVPWLQVSAAEVDGQGLGRYRLTVDRGQLGDGLYAAKVTARSSANSLQIRVLVSAGNAAVADVGVLYILVFDPALDDAVEQTAVRARDGRYEFSFPALAAGRYLVFAGSDADNDLFICDAGEACGAWLTTDQPAEINLDRNRDNIEFPADYLISLPDAATATAGGAARPGLPRRP